MIEPKPANATYNDEQWQAIHQKGTNILVAASAGSGKTTVLIERILTHVMKGFAQLDELLVCTFTESAANEMKQRMETRLKAALNQTADREQQHLLLQQLRLLPTAHIRTLHSFCLQVIQQYFYLIDFDPNFRLMTDETQKELLYQETWHTLIEHIYDEKTTVSKAQYLTLLEQSNDRALYELIVNLHHFASSHPEPEIWLTHVADQSRQVEQFAQSPLYKKIVQPYLQQTFLSAEKILQDGLQLLQQLSSETIVKYEAILQGEQQQVAYLIEAAQRGDLAAILSIGQTIAFERWPSNSQKSEDYEAVGVLKQLRDDAKALMEGLKDWFVYDYTTTLDIEKRLVSTLDVVGQLTLAFRAVLADKKADLKIIDYNDLEHLTLNILAPYNAENGRREPSLAAEFFQQQFKEVLVDEYQDINEIQATILSWLSHEQRADLDGNLFMVGDVKQSIYGFRMAEPSLFLQKYLAYGQQNGGELIILDKNYRSRDEVLQFTNFLFERLMDTNFGEMAYHEAESLKTGNHSFKPSAPNDAFNIEVLVHVKESETADEALELSDDAEIDTSIEAQSYLIAQDIQHKIQSRFKIYDKELKQTRPVEYRDFVILTATRQPFLPIQQVFEQYELPIFSQKVENYFQRQEIRLMVALLKLIDNPLQDIPLVAILRSYFVGLDDEALSLIRIACPTGNFYTACEHYIATQEDAIAEQLRTFWEQLNRWRDLSQKISLVQLIWTIYQETYFLDYVAGLSNGQQRQANLHAFYERAEQFEQTAYRGVFGFVQYIEQMMQHEHDLAEPILLADNQNSIRMMTVHASKGLEFPVVYLMNTSKTFNIMDTNQAYIPSKHYGLATDYLDTQHLLKYPSLIKKALRLEKILQLKAEEMRKLYVALTRCEQKLIIVGSITKQEDWKQQQERVLLLSDEQTLVMNTQERQQARSWFEWIVQALAFSNKHPQSCTSFTPAQVACRFVTTDELMLFRQQRKASHKLDKHDWLEKMRQIVEQSSQIPLPEIQAMQRLMNATYDYSLASRTSSYQSVSELKRLYELPHDRHLSHFEDRRSDEKSAQTHIQSIRYTQDTFEKPQFLRKKTMDYAQIGTITHFVLQQLDFSVLKPPYLPVLQTQVAELIERQLLTAEMAQVVRLEAIVQFLESDLGQFVIEHAQQLRREQAFSYLLPAKWLFQQQLEHAEVTQLANDQLLIHGVVDNFVITPKGIVLIDYKTDRYKPQGTLSRQAQIETIVEKYRFQMSLYAQALSVATQQPIARACLVLLDFGETIEIQDLYTFT
ncbi:MAG: helicase-exonuclease AddAB subunit AddA [Aerococcaceae bacterium]|nr:helicase-exonuclease AddAB subunit AddA [Aerococcaceae bacterium]